MISVFILCLIWVALVWGVLYLATARYRRILRQERSINRRKRHVPYREIGFTACKPQQDMQ